MFNLNRISKRRVALEDLVLVPRARLLLFVYSISNRESLLRPCWFWGIPYERKHALLSNFPAPLYLLSQRTDKIRLSGDSEDSIEGKLLEAEDAKIAIFEAELRRLE